MSLFHSHHNKSGSCNKAAPFAVVRHNTSTARVTNQILSTPMNWMVPILEFHGPISNETITHNVKIVQTKQSTTNATVSRSEYVNQNSEVV